MRRLLIPIVAVAASLSVGTAAHAQSTPPTTVEVETSTVQQPVTTTETKTVDTGDDDDSDKTGLWGLLGLLGLAGLAGLKRKRDDYSTTRTPPTPPTGGAAPRRPDGASSSGT
jgi:LPXTG-motif cell wall-anchored protein